MTAVLSLQLETTRADIEADAQATGDLDEFTIESIEAITKPPEVALAEARFLETVVVIVTATVAVVAKRMVEHWLKDKEQGVLIDVRPSPALISRVTGIPTGFLVIIDKGGNPTTYQGKYESAEDLAPILEAALGQT